MVLQIHKSTFIVLQLERRESTENYIWIIEHPRSYLMHQTFNLHLRHDFLT